MRIAALGLESGVYGLRYPEDLNIARRVDTCGSCIAWNSAPFISPYAACACGCAVCARHWGGRAVSVAVGVDPYQHFHPDLHLYCASIHELGLDSLYWFQNHGDAGGSLLC